VILFNLLTLNSFLVFVGHLFLLMLQVVFQRLQGSLQLCRQIVDFASDHAQIGLLVADKTEHQVENWSCDESVLVVLYD